MSSIIKTALTNSLLTAAYVSLIATIIFFIANSPIGQKEVTILGPIAMLLLFVFSAALTGFLVLGKPIMLYIDGKKQESVKTLMATIGFILMIVLIIFVVILLVY